MKSLDDNTLMAIVDLICGDDGPYYRQGWKLPLFFRAAGLDCTDHDGSTRRYWALARLEDFNREPDNTAKVLMRIADPKEYADKPEVILEVLTRLNRILAMEGLNVEIKGITPVLYEIDPYVPELTGKLRQAEGLKMAVNAPPKVFISYSWDSEPHKERVRLFAEKLRADGVDAVIDHWEVQPGDDIPYFIEKAIRENQFILIICTPQYKERSEARRGGVGYEGNIITAEIFGGPDRELDENQKKRIIPVLRMEQWNAVAPNWLKGRSFIDLRGEVLNEEEYKKLIRTLHGEWPKPPPIVSRPRASQPQTTLEDKPEVDRLDDPSGPIVIVGLLRDGITLPRDDGTAGSALYAVPFQLSREPSSLWIKVFTSTWDSPPRYTTMHRPGIVKIAGKKLVLDGTTIEEVEEYHWETLQLVIEKTNKQVAGMEEQKRKNSEAKKRRKQELAESIRDKASDLQGKIDGGNEKTSL